MYTNDKLNMLPVLHKIQINSMLHLWPSTALDMFMEIQLLVTGTLKILIAPYPSLLTSHSLNRQLPVNFHFEKKNRKKPEISEVIFYRNKFMSQKNPVKKKASTEID